MSYYYVKAPLGTNTVDGGTTKQTGSFTSLGAANVYGSIALAVSNGAGAGDIVCVSDSHYYTSSTLTYNGPVIAGNDCLSIVCVKDSACDESVKAPAIIENSTGDINFSGQLYMYGLFLQAGDDVSATQNTSSVHLDVCEVQLTSSGGHSIMTSREGSTYRTTNSIFRGLTTSHPVHATYGGLAIIEGGRIHTSTTLSSGSAGNGGAHVIMRGVDLSDVSDTLFKGIGGNLINDDYISIQVHNCKLHPSVIFLEEDIVNTDTRMSVIGSSHSSALAETQFWVTAKGGYVQDQRDTGIYRDETVAFPSETKISMKCVTNSLASMASPFWFDLSTRYAKLSSAPTGVLRVYLASTTNLGNTDVWVEVMYADGTNKHERHFLTTRHPEILTEAGNGDALTTDSGSTWMDGGSNLVGYNEYYIDIDTSGNAGADCLPSIKVYACVPSITVYFDPVVDVL